jgi:hypothetical protein
LVVLLIIINTFGQKHNLDVSVPKLSKFLKSKGDCVFIDTIDIFKLQKMKMTKITSSKVILELNKLLNLGDHEAHVTYYYIGEINNFYSNEFESYLFLYTITWNNLNESIPKYYAGIILNGNIKKKIVKSIIYGCELSIHSLTDGLPYLCSSVLFNDYDKIISILYYNESINDNGEKLRVKTWSIQIDKLGYCN